MDNIQSFKPLKDQLGNKVLFASILTVTDPKLNKGGRKDKVTGHYANPMFNDDGTCRVLKRTKTVIMLNNDYAKACRNRFKKVQDFKLKQGEITEAEYNQAINDYASQATDTNGELKRTPMSGREWVEGYENLISKATKEGEDTLYFRTYYNMGNNNLFC